MSNGESEEKTFTVYPNTKTGTCPTSDKAKGRLAAKTVDLYFQRSPGNPGAEDRGIEGLKVRVLGERWTGENETTDVDGRVVVKEETTDADGHVAVEFPDPAEEGKKKEKVELTVQLLYEGRVVSTYKIERRREEFEPVDKVSGQQRRLRILGYQLGHYGEEGYGVDGVMGRKTDRSILEFQADQEIKFDGIVGPDTKNKLEQAL